MGVRDLMIDFSDVSGGKNSAQPRHAIGNDQVVDTINLIHERIGVTRAPGYKGYAYSQMFQYPMRGGWTFHASNGNQYFIYVNNKKVYAYGTTFNVQFTDESGSVSGIVSWQWIIDGVLASTEQNPVIALQAGPHDVYLLVTGPDGSADITKTVDVGMLYILQSDNECYAVNLGGKLWICNGTDFIKIEYPLAAYQVGISAPTAGSVTNTIGTGLAAGVYSVYLSYYRESATGQRLYSFPLTIGTITLTGGYLQVTVSGLSASSDLQVDGFAVWMTDADGTIPYLYKTADKTATSIVIADTSGRNTAIKMNTWAANNQPLPAIPNGIFSFDEKLIVWVDNQKTLYWSLPDNLGFDLERFMPENFRTMSASINGVFSEQSDLYINHIGTGISKITGGDMKSIAKLVNRKNWFLPALAPIGRSNVDYHKGLPFGLTNDGVRYFSGDGFSDDLSFFIKPDIDALKNGIGTNNVPSIFVYRRSGKRTELRVSYRDLNVSSTINNSQRVLNIDMLFSQQKTCWEAWEIGFHRMDLYNDSFIATQSVDAGGHILGEDGVADYSIFNKAGAYSDGLYPKRCYLLTRTLIDRLDAITVWGAVYTLAVAQGEITGNIIIFDQNNSHFPFEIVGSYGATGVLPADGMGGLPMPFVMSGSNYPVGASVPMAFAARGNSVAVEIEQTDNDPYFAIYTLQLPRSKEILNNLT